MSKNILCKTLLFFLVFSIISGCSLIKKNDKPKVVDLKILTSKDTNLDDNSVPSPLLIDIYETKNSADFLMLDYLDFPNILEVSSEMPENKDEKRIEKPKYSWIVQPNSFLNEEIIVPENVEYLGILAHYQKTQDNDWRFIFKKQKSKRAKNYYLYLYVDKSTVKQLSKDEMKKELKQYAKSNPNDSRFTKFGRLKKQKKDYSKGVFVQEPKPTALKDSTQKLTPKIQENK